MRENKQADNTKGQVDPLATVCVDTISLELRTFGSRSRDIKESYERSGDASAPIHLSEGQSSSPGTPVTESNTGGFKGAGLEGKEPAAQEAGSISFSTQDFMHQAHAHLLSEIAAAQNDLSSRTADLRQTMSEFTARLQDERHSDIGSIKTAIGELRSVTDTNAEQYRDLKKKVDTNKRSTDAKHGLETKARKEGDAALDTKIEDTKAALGNDIANLGTALRQEITTLSASHTEALRQAVEASSDRQASLAADLLGTIDKMTELSADLAKREDKVDALISEIKDEQGNLQEQVDVLIASRDAEKNALEERYNSQISHASDAQDSGRSQDGKSQDEIEPGGDSGAVNEALSKIEAGMRLQVERLEEKYTKLLEQVREDSKTTQEGLQGELKDSRQEIAEQSAKLKELEAQRDNLAEERKKEQETLEKKLEVLDKDNKAALDNLRLEYEQKLKDAAKASEDEQKKLQNALDDSKNETNKKIEDFDKQAKSDRDKLKQEYEQKLKDAESDSQREQRKLQDALDDSKKAMDKVSDKVKDLEKNRDDIQTKLDEEKDRYRDALKRLKDDNQKNLDKIQQELSELKANGGAKSDDRAPKVTDEDAFRYLKDNYGWFYDPVRRLDTKKWLTMPRDLIEKRARSSEQLEKVAKLVKNSEPYKKARTPTEKAQLIDKAQKESIQKALADIPDRLSGAPESTKSIGSRFLGNITSMFLGQAVTGLGAAAAFFYMSSAGQAASVVFAVSAVNFGWNALCQKWADRDFDATVKETFQNAQSADSWAKRVAYTGALFDMVRKWSWRSVLFPNRLDLTSSADVDKLDRGLFHIHEAGKYAAKNMVRAEMDCLSDLKDPNFDQNLARFQPYMDTIKLQWNILPGIFDFTAKASSLCGMFYGVWRVFG